MCTVCVCRYFVGFNPDGSGFDAQPLHLFSGSEMAIDWC